MQQASDNTWIFQKNNKFIFKLIVETIALLLLEHLNLPQFVILDVCVNIFDKWMSEMSYILSQT